jgi:hypothetical protein
LSNLNLFLSIFDLKPYLMIPKELYSNFSGLDSSKSFILLPMDESTQQNHLKRNGLLWCLENYKASWLLNPWWFFLVTGCSRHTQGMSD